MKSILYTTAILSFLFFSSCSCPTKAKDTAKWSVRMANTIMEGNDSLTKYLGAAESKRWQYDVAMLAQTIDKLGNVDPKYSKYMVDYVNCFIDSLGNIQGYKMDEYNLDNLNPGKNLITLYKRTGEEKYHKAILQLVSQMNSHPRTKEGGFWHKKRYPYQMWLDGIYMAEPFLAQYAREFNDPKWFDEAVFQISTIYKRTLDPKTGLLYHAYDESHEQKWSNPATGVSPNFWSRSMGWYTMAIVDVLDYLPETHPGRDTLISILKRTCDALLKARDPNTGLWYQVLDQGNREGNYIEGSGSAMFIYSFAKGAKKGYLDSKYLDIANKAFDSYVKTLITTNEKGQITIHHICGGCGLGGNPYRDGSYNYYVTEKQVDNDTKGVGPFILAALELDK